MRDFINGEASAEGYLPDNVKKFAAMDYYFRSVHLSGSTLPDDDIEEYLEERFGENTLSSSIVEAVEEYAAGLRGYQLYSGQELQGYMQGLSDEAGEMLLRESAAAELHLCRSLHPGCMILQQQLTQSTLWRKRVLQLPLMSLPLH
jgi:hypothetical protein